MIIMKYHNNKQSTLTFLFMLVFSQIVYKQVVFTYSIMILILQHCIIRIVSKNNCEELGWVTMCYHLKSNVVLVDMIKGKNGDLYRFCKKPFLRILFDCTIDISYQHQILQQEDILFCTAHILFIVQLSRYNKKICRY